MENECFPSLFKEGCIRQQYSLMVLSACGDGVVIVKSEWLITTTSPKSMKLAD
jgi:hypothetical protein